MGNSVNVDCLGHSSDEKATDPAAMVESRCIQSLQRGQNSGPLVSQAL